MNRLYRPLAAILVSATALHLVGCTGEEPGSPPGVTFTTSPDLPSAQTPRSTSPQAPTTGVTAEPTGTDQTPSPTDGGGGVADDDGDIGVIEGVSVTVSAPEEQTMRLDNFYIIQVGENRFEMVKDLRQYTQYKTLPAVSWKTGTQSGKCSTHITYSDQAGQVIARKDSRQCGFTADSEEADNDVEWVDRSLLPERGSEAPVTVRVSVTPDGGTEATGEQTVIIRNPATNR